MRSKAVLLTGLVLAFAAMTQLHAAPPSPTITIQVYGGGTVVSSDSGIACPTDCSETYAKKTVVVLTAVPDYSYVLTSWGGACSGTQDTCTVTMNTATSVTAVFEQAYPGPTPQTGQTLCYSLSEVQVDCAGTGQDGEYQAGVLLPNPRFANNLNGTVTDNLTGLIWLRDANCFGVLATRDAVFAAAKTLADGACGLSDGSIAGEWRVPNVREMYSLVDVTTLFPALPPGHPFLNVPQDDTAGYVTSTYLATRLGQPGTSAWWVNFKWGEVQASGIANSLFWAVRGP